MGLRDTFLKTLQPELHRCTPYAMQPCNSPRECATVNATSVQQSAAIYRQRDATGNATNAQHGGCTGFASCQSENSLAVGPAAIVPAPEFTTRRARLLRWGYSTDDAEALAERLTRRDRSGDDRVSCTECASYRPGRCGNYRAALLHSADMGRDLAGLLQRCPGFQTAIKSGATT